MFEDSIETVETPKAELALVAPIGKNHHSIAQVFIDRIMGMLQDNPTLKKYSVEEDWRNSESMELRIDDKTVLQIQLIRSK